MANPSDSIHKTVSEMKPIVACLIHPHVASSKEFKARREGWGGIAYGLCSDCLVTLSKYPQFQQCIDVEIDERIQLLKESYDDGV